MDYLAFDCAHIRSLLPTICLHRDGRGAVWENALNRDGFLCTISLSIWFITNKKHGCFLLAGHFRKVVTLCQRLNVFPNDLLHPGCVLIGKLFPSRNIAKGIPISLHEATGIDESSRSSAHQLSLDQRVNNWLHICTGHPHRIGNTTHRNGIFICQIQDVGFNIRTHKRERFAFKSGVPHIPMEAVWGS